MATGVLVIGIERATKILGLLMSTTKSYRVIPLLSTRTRPSRDFAIATVVPPVVVLLANANAAIYTKLRPTQEIEFFEARGTLYLRKKEGNLTTVRQLAWDPAAYGVWRLRQQAGTTYWEISADGGATFVVQAQSTGFTVGGCQLELGAGAVQSTTSASPALFARALVTGP